MVDVLGLDRAGRQDRIAGCVGGQAVLVDTAGLEALGVGRIAQDVAPQLVARRQIVGEVPVVEAGRADLRGIDRQLRDAASAGLAQQHRNALAVIDLALVVPRFLVVVQAQARRHGQGVGHLPVDLAEHREALALQPLGVARREAVQDAGVVRQCVAGRDVPAAGGCALLLGSLGVDALLEREGADHEVKGLGLEIVAQFLAVLVLLRGVLGLGHDRQPQEIAVVLRLPIPEAPGGDRGQGPAADVPDQLGRGAADLVARVQIRVDVGHSVEGIGAGNRIAQRGGEGRILSVRRPLGGPGAHIDLGAALRVLAAVVGGQCDREVFAGLEQQLAAQAQIVLLIDVATAGDVVDRAAAVRARHGQANGDLVAQRPGDRGLGLLVVEVPQRDLGIGLEVEGRLPSRDVDRAGRGVLAIKRALRAAQDLDPVDIQEVEGRRGDA